MQEYLDLCNKILQQGHLQKNRTNIDTLSLFGHQMRFNLAKGFPLLTTKKVNFKAIVHELLWFLKGDTNIKYLVDHDVKIWNEWAFQKFVGSPEYQNETLQEFVAKIKNSSTFALKFGDLGPVYGKQWRDFSLNEKTVDQISILIQNLKQNPFSRRHVVSAWNPHEIENMALPPCHTMFQFYVSPDYKLSCQLYQRSGDVFLGIPFNIASYALLTMMIASVCQFSLGEFVHTIGDAHIYVNHIPQINTQLARTPKPLPRLVIKSNTTDLFAFKFDDFQLENYNPDSFLKGEVAV